MPSDKHARFAGPLLPPRRPLLRRLALLAGFGLVLLVALAAAGAGLSRALERSVTYRYLDEALRHSPAPPEVVSWLPGPDLDRSFGPGDQAQAGRALAEAWALFAAALASGDGAALGDGFAGPALARAEAAVAASPGLPGLRSAVRLDAGAALPPPDPQAPAPGMAVLHLAARPMFHHMDGSLLQIDAQALTLRFALTPAGDLAQMQIALDQTRSVLDRASSGWKILLHERAATTDLSPRAAPLPPRAPRLAGVNYYPAATPWSGFWAGYDPAVTARDFARIRGLGANAVRVFLTRADFLDPVQGKARLAALQDLLDQAAAQDLWVVPVLFDLRAGYEPHLWAHDHAWLRAVLPVLARAPNVAVVDLKNEPDLDYPRHGKGLVQAWLAGMAVSARAIAPDLPLTVGFASAAPAAELADWVDQVSYHDYADTGGSAGRLAVLRAQAAGKPVLVTEIGASSWGILPGLPGSPGAQSRVLGTRMAALAPAEGIFVWTLHDFPRPDPAAIGHSPWVAGLQSEFGLIDARGAEKPAAATVRRFFAGYLAPDPPPKEPAP